MTAAVRAAARLNDERESLARELTDRLYSALPQLPAKYGAAGRDKCLQDMRYTLEYLAPAVHMQDPQIFARYVRWLDELLRARNVDTAEVVRTLELLHDIVAERFDSDETVAVAPSIRAGLDVLQPAHPA